MDEQIEQAARLVMERCELLGQYSEEPGLLVRRYASPAMREVNALVAAWMESAGMATHRDQVGNLIGRYAGEREDGPTLLLGSHLDTVRDAGKYDGPLGVLLALGVIERLHQRGEQLPFALELLAFADEEGLRYHSAYLGSQAVAGTFDPASLSLLDRDGISLAEAMRAFGGDPEHLALAKRASNDLLGYCEVHIEQGPVLEARDLPVGLVSAITGQSSFDVTWRGEAGHAGTVPMSLRHDALCAAAEFILAVENYARDVPGLVATIGQLSVHPGASNVIPGQVTLSLDVRHQEDTRRVQACAELEQRAQHIAAAREVSLRWTPLQENRAVQCAPRLIELLSQAIKQSGFSPYALPSGAGHDGVSMSELTDVAMLFVRCGRGISHNPAESVRQEDVAVAIEALERFLTLLAQKEKQP